MDPWIHANVTMLNMECTVLMLLQPGTPYCQMQHPLPLACILTTFVLTQRCQMQLQPDVLHMRRSQVVDVCKLWFIQSI